MAAVLFCCSHIFSDFSIQVLFICQQMAVSDYGKTDIFLSSYPVSMKFPESCNYIFVQYISSKWHF